MTATLTPDDVRASHPEWLIWHLGTRWWAMHRATAATVNADSLPDLGERLTGTGVASEYLAGRAPHSGRPVGSGGPR